MMLAIRHNAFTLFSSWNCHVMPRHSGYPVTAVRELLIKRIGGSVNDKINATTFMFLRSLFHVQVYKTAVFVNTLILWNVFGEFFQACKLPVDSNDNVRLISTYGRKLRKGAQSLAIFKRDDSYSFVPLKNQMVEKIGNEIYNKFERASRSAWAPSHGLMMSLLQRQASL